MAKKIGVLLVNLGTPDYPDRKSVYRYLKEFLLDKRVIDIPWLQRNLLVRLIIAPFRSGPSSKLYQKLWTKDGSPLKTNGYKLLEGVKELLGEGYEVELAMRYQTPTIKAGLEALRKKTVDEIIVFPLFPHYASASTGSVHEEVMKIISEWQVIPELKLINSYYDLEGMIDVFVENARKYDIASYDHILFSYHGLPQRQMIKANDFGHCLSNSECCQNITDVNKFCYSAQCFATTKALVKKMELKEGQYTTCFQSRLGKDPWIQPYTAKTLIERRNKGDKSLLVFCPAFVSDCLETTVEVTDEYRNDFIKLGGEKLDLVESLNDNPHWMAVVADYIKAQN
jgi:ferrochelatase